MGDKMKVRIAAVALIIVGLLTGYELVKLYKEEQPKTVNSIIHETSLR
jgi:hypothetical protein